MPLDPLLKTMLEQMAEQPPIHTLAPAEARLMMAAMGEAMSPKDVPIGKTENVTMPGEAGDIALRIYTPVAAGSTALPALIFFHGGGFVIGDLDSHDGICRILANEAGVKVIAVHYRLAPDHKFPAAVNDAIAAVNWVEGNAASLGVDANRLAVGGDSAGGCLAAVAAQTAKEKGRPHLACQLLMFPVTHVGGETASMAEFGEGYFLERASMDWFMDHYLPDEMDRGDPRVSPLKAKDVGGLPPAIVVLAGFDPLHDEGLAYAERLRDAGVPVTLADYPDMVHDFILMYELLPQAARALSHAAAALKQALAG